METVGLLLLGAGVRVLQALALSAPTLLSGLVIAGVFRRLLGPKNVVRLFGGTSWRGLPQSWLIGMLLPVCSLGVLPVLREMRRAGVAGGAILAFALSAPLFNPISVLYGLTLSHPSVILVFAFCSLVLVTVVALAWGKLFNIPELGEPPPQQVPVGWRRMAALLVAICRETTSASVVYILWALAGVALLALVLPSGSLQFTMYHQDPWSPFLMMAVALPAYVTPTNVIGQLGSMFDHGNSIGAALVLLTAGAGVNFGLVAWLKSHFGWRCTMGWLLLFVVVVLGLAYAVENPLHYAGSHSPADHTHAFDSYCAPFSAHSGDVGPELRRKLFTDVGKAEWRALYVVLGLTLLGGLLKLLDRWFIIEEWLERTPTLDSAHAAAATKPRYDVVVPEPVLGAVALVGVIVFSIYGCYIYFPPPEDVFAEMSAVRANALIEARTGDPEEAEWWLLYYDALTHKLEAGAYIRGWVVTEQMQEANYQLRQSLDKMRHAAEDGETELVAHLYYEIPKLAIKLAESYRYAPRRSWAKFFPPEKGRLIRKAKKKAIKDGKKIKNFDADRGNIQAKTASARVVFQ